MTNDDVYYTARARPAMYRVQLLAASRQDQCMHQMLGQELWRAECDIDEVFSAVRQGNFHTQPVVADGLHRHITSKHQKILHLYHITLLITPSVFL